MLQHLRDVNADDSHYTFSLTRRIFLGLALKLDVLQPLLGGQPGESGKTETEWTSVEYGFDV